MTAHTPGPWSATTTPAGKGKVVDSDGFSVANATAAQWAQGVEDARLIAAAPDLLAALISMEAKASKQNWNDAYPDQLESARAAIAKATGASA